MLSTIPLFRRLSALLPPASTPISSTIRAGYTRNTSSLPSDNTDSVFYLGPDGKPVPRVTDEDPSSASTSTRARHTTGVEDPLRRAEGAGLHRHVFESDDVSSPNVSTSRGPRSESDFFTRKPSSSSGVPGDDANPFFPSASGVDDAEDSDSGSHLLSIEDFNLDFERDMSPSEVVGELDRNIIGQMEAKRAVAIALRNRWRRQRLAPDMREEVMPKNILMIGPTGVGKTEIARRLARLTQAPFLKVEATKFTEVGFVGRDVDQIVRDLVEISITQTRKRMFEVVRKKVSHIVENKIIDALTGLDARQTTKDTFREMLRSGALEDRKIRTSIPTKPVGVERFSGRGGGGDFFGMVPGMNDVFAQMKNLFPRSPQRGKPRELSIREARPLLEEAEVEKHLSSDLLVREAINAAEQNGIVFIDEIDKICNANGRSQGGNIDASAEGVQRDLLPLVEGTTVSTKYGNVKTEWMLFIASGAFHHVKPSDLLPELQGRLPIRVELKGLDQSDLFRILTEPEHNLLKQQIALLATEGVEVQFTESAIKEMAKVAMEVNSSIENIGARRLHTIIERVMDPISFNAPSLKGQTIVVDVKDVRKHVDSMLLKTDLSKFIL